MPSAYDNMASSKSAWSPERDHVDPERAKRLQQGVLSEPAIFKIIKNGYSSMVGDAKPKRVDDSPRE